MLKGKVKWFNAQKGFGFISSEGKDYFVHYRDIKTPGFKKLDDGQNVYFETKTTPKGIAADNVEPITD